MIFAASYLLNPNLQLMLYLPFLRVVILHAFNDTKVVFRVTSISQVHTGSWVMTVAPCCVFLMY